MTKPKPKVGCYVRVSTATRKRPTDKDHKPEFRQTTKSQRHAIRQWAKTAHIPDGELTWYEDRRSGKSLQGRDALARLMRHVAEGRIDTVVVYDLSRLARNLIDGLKTLAELSAKVRAVSISENIDFGNSTGALIASILLAVAQFQRELTVEKIRAGLAARKADGHRLGRPRNDKRLSEVLKLHESGVGATEIANRLGCSRANVYGLLSRAV